MTRKPLTAILASLVMVVGTIVGLTSGRGESLLLASASTTGNNLKLFDDKQENFSYGYTSVYEAGYQARTVIAFDIPVDDDIEIETINRLTVEVKYLTWAWWDLAKIWPNEWSKTSIISAEDTYNLRILVGNQFVISKTNVPRIGVSGDFPSAMLQFKDISATDPAKMQENWQNKYDVFADKDYYLIMPFDYTYEAVYISIDAYTTDGDHISDGTNDGGFFEDEIGYYYEFDLSSPYIHFTSTTRIRRLVVTGFSNAPLIQGTFNFVTGQYDYETNEIVMATKAAFTANETRIVNILVEATSEGYIYGELGAGAILRVYYEAETPIVSYNLRDDEGNLPDPVEEPYHPDPWLRFRQAWTDLQNMADFLIVIATIVIGLILFGLVFYFVLIPMVKFIKALRKG